MKVCNLLSSVLFAIFVLVLLIGTTQADQSAETNQFQANWESLRQHEIPEWLLDAKFGIYAHWGIYSVGIGPAWTEKFLYNPEYSEGKPDNQNLHRKFEALVGGGLKDGKGYKDLVRFFTADKYDAAAWADLIVKSRAKYAGFSIAHHDGFGLWDSDVYEWNAGKMGPQKDLYGMFVKELHERDVKIIATEHMYRTFGWMNPPEKFMAQAKAENWDVLNPANKNLYSTSLNGGDYESFLKLWNLKMREVIDKYQPDLIWCDGGRFDLSDTCLQTFSYYFNQAQSRGQQVGILNKRPMRKEPPWFNFPEDFGMYDFEHGRDRPVVVDRPLVDSMTITGRGWNYTGYDGAISCDEFLKNLIDDVSRGGAVLLSLAPRADGTIPDAQQQLLIQIGKWLDMNGEAIFDTRPWKYPSDDTPQQEKSKYLYEYKPGHTRWNYGKMNNDDVRYTMNKPRSILYILTIGSPRGKTITARRLNSLENIHIKTISLLGSSKQINWNRDDDGLKIELPETRPSDMALSFKVILEL
jgi:alpha-L-fucosidase